MDFSESKGHWIQFNDYSSSPYEDHDHIGKSFTLKVEVDNLPAAPSKIHILGTDSDDESRFEKINPGNSLNEDVLYASDYSLEEYQSRQFYVSRKINMWKGIRPDYTYKYYRIVIESVIDDVNEKPVSVDEIVFDEPDPEPVETEWVPIIIQKNGARFPEAFEELKAGTGSLNGSLYSAGDKWSSGERHYVANTPEVFKDSDDKFTFKLVYRDPINVENSDVENSDVVNSDVVNSDVEVRWRQEEDPFLINDIVENGGNQTGYEALSIYTPYNSNELNEEQFRGLAQSSRSNVTYLDGNTYPTDVHNNKWWWSVGRNNVPVELDHPFNSIPGDGHKYYENVELYVYNTNFSGNITYQITLPYKGTDESSTINESFYYLMGGTITTETTFDEATEELHASYTSTITNIPGYILHSKATQSFIDALSDKLSTELGADTENITIVVSNIEHTSVKNNLYGASSSGTPQIVTDGLVLNVDAANSQSYPGSGTTWTDLSGHGNDVTLHGGVGYNSNNGGALSLDGSNDKLTGDLSGGGFTEEYTMIVWFKFDQGTRTAGSGRMDIIYGPFHTQPSVGFDGDGSGKLTLAYKKGGNPLSMKSTTSTWINNKWYMVAVSGSNMEQKRERIYVDGVIENEINDMVGSYDSWSGFSTGMRNFGAGVTTFFHGQISAFQFYDRELSELEVQQNFNALSNRYGIITHPANQLIVESHYDGGVVQNMWKSAHGRYIEGDPQSGLERFKSSYTGNTKSYDSNGNVYSGEWVQSYNYAKYATSFGVGNESTDDEIAYIPDDTRYIGIVMLLTRGNGWGQPTKISLLGSNSDDFHLETNTVTMITEKNFENYPDINIGSEWIVKDASGNFYQPYDENDNLEYEYQFDNSQITIPIKMFEETDQLKQSTYNYYRLVIEQSGGAVVTGITKLAYAPYIGITAAEYSIAITDSDTFYAIELTAESLGCDVKEIIVWVGDGNWGQKYGTLYYDEEGLNPIITDENNTTGDGQTVVASTNGDTSLTVTIYYKPNGGEDMKNERIFFRASSDNSKAGSVIQKFNEAYRSPDYDKLEDFYFGGYSESGRNIQWVLMEHNG